MNEQAVWEQPCFSHQALEVTAHPFSHICAKLDQKPQPQGGKGEAPPLKGKGASPVVFECLLRWILFMISAQTPKELMSWLTALCSSHISPSNALVTYCSPCHRGNDACLLMFDDSYTEIFNTLNGIILFKVFQSQGLPCSVRGSTAACDDHSPYQRTGLCLLFCFWSSSLTTCLGVCQRMVRAHRDPCPSMEMELLAPGPRPLTAVLCVMSQ